MLTNILLSLLYTSVVARQDESIIQFSIKDNANQDVIQNELDSHLVNPNNYGSLVGPPYPVTASWFR